jgi:hypothetical protein
MRALARAWRIGAFLDRKVGPAPQEEPRGGAPIARIGGRPLEREQEHRGLTARELIRMAQAARMQRD